jgi:ABC-2 type transport system permease protein
MRKYLEVFRTTLGQYFAYRLNFILWRFRAVLNLFIIYFLWQSVFEGRRNLFGYSKTQMLTYILLSSLISNFVLGTRTVDIAGEILSGDIINYILKPFSFFKYYLARDFIDKLLNLSFAIFEISLIIILFKPPVLIQNNFSVFIPFIIFIFLGTLISFFVNISLSFIGFWSNEVWAPRFIYFVLISFLCGTYFPLNILPKPVYYFLLLTPFPYFYYLPTKIYLLGVDKFLLFEIFICFVWVYLSYRLSKFLWQKGLKSYGFFGR